MVGVFGVSVGALLYTYFIYPGVLWALGKMCAWRGVRPRVPRRGTLGAESSPGASTTPVSFVVAAYNEAGCIGAKVRNCLGVTYPPEALDVVVGSDGSSDGTDAIVAGLSDARARLSPGRRGGKVSVLNRCIPTATGSIVVLTDANTEVDASAVEKMARHFVDPRVGAVCGQLRLFNPTRQEYEESLYWRYETWIKCAEGRLGVVLGANGGIYAIRRELYESLPPQTIVDDFVIPLRLVLAGYRLVYEPEAIAREETTEDVRLEARRRVRIAAGNFQSLAMVGRLLLPTRRWALYSFAFWSHKLLRWTAPLLMALAAVASLASLDRAWGRCALAVQLSFYLLAATSRLGDALPDRLRRAASIAGYFTSMNWAMAVGFWRFVSSAQGPTWDRTPRAP